MRFYSAKNKVNMGWKTKEHKSTSYQGSHTSAETRRAGFVHTLIVLL